MNPMPDNWSYVFAAYGVAAVALIGYWRYLSARARALTDGRRGASHGGRAGASRVTTTGLRS